MTWRRRSAKKYINRAGLTHIKETQDPREQRGALAPSQTQLLHRPQQGEQAHSEKIEENELDRERKEARVSECPHRGPGAISNRN